MPEEPYRRPPLLKLAVLYTATWYLSYWAARSSRQGLVTCEVNGWDSLTGTIPPAETLHLAEYEQRKPPPPFYNSDNGRQIDWASSEITEATIECIHIDQIIPLP